MIFLHQAFASTTHSFLRSTSFILWDYIYQRLPTFPRKLEHFVWGIENSFQGTQQNLEHVFFEYLEKEEEKQWIQITSRGIIIESDTTDVSKRKKQGYLYFSKENLKFLEIALAIRSYGATFLPCTFCFLFGKFFEHKDTEEHEMGHFVYVISQTDVHSFFSCTVKNIKGVTFVLTEISCLGNFYFDVIIV